MKLSRAAKVRVAICLLGLTIIFGCLAYTVDPPYTKMLTDKGLVYLTTEQDVEFLRKMVYPEDPSKGRYSSLLPTLKKAEERLSWIRMKRRIYFTICVSLLIFTLVCVWSVYRDMRVVRLKDQL